MEIKRESIDRLPEECISHVISLTSPRDACVSAAVSHYFRSAVDSDAMWHRLLPSDYASYVDPAEYASKKELYFRLCDRPVIIDGGLMSFGLDKSSGAKIFMISARKLDILGIRDPQLWWIWIDCRDSRFDQCALLRTICWLEFSGNINSEILTPNTSYAAYLVFKLTGDARGFGNPFQKTKVAHAGTESEHSVCLNQTERENYNPGLPQWVNGGELEEMRDDVIHPTHRQDGWLEVKLGEFYNGEGIGGDVHMSFKEIEGGHWKNGLIVQGIEVRPRC